MDKLDQEYLAQIAMQQVHMMVDDRHSSYTVPSGIQQSEIATQLKRILVTRN